MKALIIVLNIIFFAAMFWHGNSLRILLEELWDSALLWALVSCEVTGFISMVCCAVILCIEVKKSVMKAAMHYIGKG